ncbi:MAG: hypothetical protein IPJ21_13040 [Sterolibacteriaceae bacterium]|nr:hypothetical protein [Sterolibacteriaceae bacterium]
MKIVSKFVVISTLAVASMSGFAAGGGGGAPEIVSGARVTVSNNKALRIVSGGADVGVGAGGLLGKLAGAKVQVDASGETNVNSVILSNGGKIAGTVLVDSNKAEDVYNLGGGTMNVNSVVLK